MNRIVVWIALTCCVAFNSCNSSSNEEGNENVEAFESERYLVDNDYPDIDSIALDIMDKLQICTLSDTILRLPPCSSKYFRVFQYRTDKAWKDGFIVEMVPGIYGSPVHQLVVVENYLGKYRIVNQYLGELIEMRSTAEGYHDLLIGYNDPYVGLVSIRHEWQGGMYDVVDVEEINNHFVKPEMKDSINAVFLPAFAGGH